jgi:hypothetical protein
MKRFISTVCILTVLTGLTIALIPNSSAYAEGHDDYIFSPVSNSVWVIKKSTRQLIFIQFQKKDEIWKSNPVPVPASFNLEKCVLTSVGSRGTAAFLHDTTSGIVTLFDVQKDHSTDTYPIVNVHEALTTGN